MHAFLVRAAAPLAFLSALVSVPVAAQPSAPVPAETGTALPIGSTAPAAKPLVQSEADALAQDAGEYARMQGVSVEEAMRRLRAQAETVAETDRIRRQYRKRLAGIAVEHRPDYRIVVLLTGSGKVPDRTILAGDMKVPIVFRTGAEASRDELLAALAEHFLDLRSTLSRSLGIGVDQRSGELVLTVRAADAQRYGIERLQTEMQRRLGVPARVRVLERPDANAAIEGGARVEGIEPSSGRRNFCTTGFVVTDGERSGIITAAHCPDSLTYRGRGEPDVPLGFVGQWGWSYQDVQVHVSEAAQQPLFYADTAKRTLRVVTGAQDRAGTRAGDFVCHRGERTGYSCAEVELVDYAPPGDLCGGPCAPSWVTVAGPSCGGGDSGGPVFRGTVAYGIVKGASYDASGRCNFYYYMSTDYLPLGWSLLTGAPGATQPAAPAPTRDASPWLARTANGS